MKDTALLLLCAVALANAFEIRTEQKSRECNCDPSEAEKICEANYGEDISIAHEYCDKFYKCASGKPVEFRCPNNLLYNPYTEICDWPDNVECGDRPISDDDSDCDEDTDSDASQENDGTCNCNPEEAPAICAVDGSDGTLIAHEYCNWFYVCNHGKPVGTICPTGLLYNPYRQRCDWPDNVDCGDKIIFVPEDNDSESDEEADDDGDNDGTCNCNPEEAPAICAAPDSDGVLIAHEYCDKYYICNYGRPITVRCPAQLLYNPYTQQCDWPRNVDCGDRIVPEPDCNCDSDECDLPPGGDDINDPPAGDDSDGNDNEPVGGGHDNPSEAPEICEAEDSDGILIAHENCNQFYVCQGGKPIVLSCPDNLLFNPNTDRCDWPENVDCGDRIIPEPEDGDNDNDDGNDEDDEEIVGGGNDNPSEAPEICAADDSEGILIAHENCNQFYICNDGKPVVLTCPGNLLFNPNTDRCEWPENVDCGDRIIPEPEDGDNDNNDENDENNEDEEEIVGGGNDNPSEAPEICAADDSDGILIAHENCNQFYICNDGKPVVLTCPGNLLFNPNTDRCEWPENVDCGDRIIPEPEDGDNDNNDENDEDDEEIIGGGNDNPSEAPEICAADDSEGILIAHENCNQFYICNDGKPVVLTCPGNLLFNPNTDRCEWPENVDCGDRIVPDGDDDLPPGGDDGGNDDLPPGGDDGGNDDLPPGGDDGESDDLPPGGDDGGNDDLPPGGDDGGNDDLPPGGDDGGNDDLPPGGDDGGNDELPPGGDDGGNDELPPGGDDGGNDDLPPGGDDGGNDELPPGGDDGGNDELPPGGDDGGNDEMPPGGDDDGNDDLPPGGDDGENDDLPPGGDDGENDDLPPGGDEDCDDGTGNDCNCDPSEAETICSKPGSEGVLVAHEYCNKFYKCSSGKPVAMKCPANLLYDPIRELCDWPSNVDCGDRPIFDPEEEDDNNDDSDEEVSCNCNPEDAPAICAAEGSDNVLIAHENCNQFYQCWAGKPVALSCPRPLLYNPYKEYCDFAENVECGDRIIPEFDDDDDVSAGGNDSEENDDFDVHDDPSQAPEICAAPGSEGVLVAHENCDQYYVCNGGLPVAMTCPGNLLFNPLKNYCDWPGNVDCGDRIVPETDDDCACNYRNAPKLCASSESDGKMIAHENCNQFYMCAGRVPEEHKCPGKLLYNPDKEACDWPQNVDCNNNIVRKLPYSAVIKASNDTACNCNPSEAESICAISGSEGVLVAHEYCNKFYKCNFGKPVAIKCPSTLLYDPVNEICDWPLNVECGDRPISDPEEEDDNNDDSDEDVSCNCNPADAPAICAAEGSDHVLIAHENCNQFYQCWAGLPVALSCPRHLLYNPYKEYCDFPDNFDCGDRVIPEFDDDEDVSAGGNDNESDESESFEVHEDPSEAPKICAAAGSDGVLVAHENCSQYYVCSGGVPVAMSCPGDLLFNPLKNWCDWPSDVVCGDRIPPETDDDCVCNYKNAPKLCAASEYDGKLIAHENCNQFYMCAGRVPVEHKCPGKLLYNPDKNMCDWPQNVNCNSKFVRKLPFSAISKDSNDRECNCNPSEAESICAISGSEGVHIAHEYCNHFYKCSSGKPVAFKCPSTLLYDPVSEMCDWPFNVECGDRPIPEPEEEEDNSEDSDEEVSCNCNPADAPAICAAEGSENIMIAHENCNQYYQCWAGLPVALSCPRHLLYNPYKEYCDFPDNIDCGDRIIPEFNDDDEDDVEDDDNDSDDSDSFEVHDDPSEAPKICAAADSEGVLVAHENCNEYYICNGGSPVAVTCPSGLLFNPLRNWCDWASNVDCGDRIVPEPDCECRANAEALCKKPDSNGKMAAHENCNQFYKCFEGQPIEHQCPANLLFNPDEAKCDMPQNVDCNNRKMAHSALNKHLKSRQSFRN